jgi:hypothetical protein
MPSLAPAVSAAPSVSTSSAPAPSSTASAAPYEVLIVRSLEEVPLGEAAVRLGLPERRVRLRLARGKQVLRETLEALGTSQSKKKRRTMRFSK